MRFSKYSQLYILAVSFADLSRSAKRDPYIVAQKMIILGRTDALFDQFVDLLEQIQETVSEE